MLKIRSLFYILGTQFPLQGVRGFYGTGSYPCPPQGWHLLIRLIVSHNPFIGPYFFKASIPYCEQVGVYRHLGPSQGEMIH